MNPGKALAGFLLYGVFGLWPIWISIAYVWSAIAKHPNSDGNAALPWIIVIAVPFALGTLLVAKLIGYLYSRSEGHLPRDLRLPHVTTAVLVAGTVAFTIDWWSRNAP